MSRQSDAEARFRARVAELGGTLIGSYVDTKTGVPAICAAGHECRPIPHNVMQRQGLCIKCARKEWDALYVVASAAAVKFGISNGDSRRRLAEHRRAGYLTVVRLRIGLPSGIAQQIEDTVLATLRLAGSQPLRGREYFDIGALALVLDVVDNYPIEERAAS